MKLFSVLKRSLTAFFIIFIYKPGRRVLRFIFYKIVVKLYLRYLALIKKLGWRGFKDKGVSFLFNQKLTHLLVIFITFVIVFVNLSTKTKAVGINENAHKTIIAGLITSEFGLGKEDQLIEEFVDESGAVTPTQQRYLDSSASVQSQPMALMDSGESEEDTPQLTQGGTALVKPDMVSTKITKQPRKEIIDYIVEPGDTVSTIAQEFEISVNTILWENKLSAYSIIRPGDKLAILPMTGITYSVSKGDTLASIAKKYDAEEENIIGINKLADASQLQIGEKIIVPGGKKETYASYQPTTYSGIAAISSLVKPANALAAGGNKMNWPTVRQKITQYFSWRHLALDIADKLGTPIYAADAGTVESLGWSSGYGNQIVIDHGGGKKTRYAHLSKFYVKKGQQVSKGETIAAMGSTGWSTGSHLHFEVIINGRKYNPLNYIK
jgi:LysM repeat protein